MKKSVDVKYIQFLKFSVDVGSIKKKSKITIGTFFTIFMYMTASVWVILREITLLIWEINFKTCGVIFTQTVFCIPRNKLLRINFYPRLHKGWNLQVTKIGGGEKSPRVSFLHHRLSLFNENYEFKLDSLIDANWENGN